MTVQQVQQAIDGVPNWANWLVIGGSAALSWIQPIAGIVAIVWGVLQIFSWVRNEIRARRKRS